MNTDPDLLRLPAKRRGVSGKISKAKSDRVGGRVKTILELDHSVIPSKRTETASTKKTRAATIPKVADSKSLHNYTLSPGWS